MNSIMVLKTYDYNGVWVFDDPNARLVREAFVSGVPEIFAVLHKKYNITNPKDGFLLYFSKTPFPEHQCKAEWKCEEFGGNWYTANIDGVKMDGWLCPALFKYFDTAPKELYVRVASLQTSPAVV